MLSSGNQRAIFYVIESNEPRDCGKLVTFVLRRNFQPAMSKKGMMLRRLDEAHRVKRNISHSENNCTLNVCTFIPGIRGKEVFDDFVIADGSEC